MRVVKATLSTGKVVIFREMKISHTEMAAQEVAKKADGDSNLLQVFMQKALVKALLIQVDGKDLSAMDKEDMDNLFSMAEYGQVLTVIKEMSGGDDMGKSPVFEIVNSGDK
jgi:hypothetical protein